MNPSCPQIPRQTAATQQGGAVLFYAAFQGQLRELEFNPILFNNVLVNQGSAYSNDSGVFIAPVAGIYQFLFAAQLCRGNHNNFWYFMVNGKQGASCHAQVSGGDTTLSTCYCLEDLKKGDLSRRKLEGSFGNQVWIGLFQETSDSEWKWSKTDEIANFTNWDSRKKTWDQALRHCRLLEAKNPQKPVNLRWNYRYELASVLTPDDRAYARLRAGEASTDQVWTGLRLLAGQWFWTGDGEAVQDVDEEMQCGRTQSFCGVLVKNSTKSYETEDCSKKLNFLCYRKPLNNQSVEKLFSLF
ncbi:Complement C1q-like protein 4 [Dissostichus eleginoides]|uniref:Complement C1q-like protein 4 n=1 Tax=Dissostichus eleginoides TaxID=100907 RepID=A0AAD9B5J4_DISEL|nr:Complement C1q-like protein 4 [Dissostichus eleginoides]